MFTFVEKFYTPGVLPGKRRLENVLFNQPRFYALLQLFILTPLLLLSVLLVSRIFLPESMPRNALASASHLAKVEMHPVAYDGMKPDTRTDK